MLENFKNENSLSEIMLCCFSFVSIFTVSKAIDDKSKTCLGLKRLGNH